MELGELQRRMTATYGERDRARGVPATVAWLTEELGELAQAVRKGSAEEQLHELGDVLAWLASLAEQLGLSLDDAVARYADGLPPLRRVPLPLPLTTLLCALITAWRRWTHTERSGRSAGVAAGVEGLGDLDRVEGGALAEVVAGEEEREAAAVGDGGVVAEAADVGDVAAGDLERGRHVVQLDAVGAGEDLAACAGESGRSNRALIDIEWPANTGTRTQRTDTSRSGRPRILRLSLRSFWSSSVSSAPSSMKLPACGMTLKAIVLGNFSAAGKLDRARRRG